MITWFYGNNILLLPLFDWVLSEWVKKGFRLMVHSTKARSLFLKLEWFFIRNEPTYCRFWSIKPLPGDFWESPKGCLNQSQSYLVYNFAGPFQCDYGGWLHHKACFIAGKVKPESWEHYYEHCEPSNFQFQILKPYHMYWNAPQKGAS